LQTILRWIRWIIGAALAILVIGFAIANRQRVLISFNPLAPGGTFSSLEMPLWLLFFFGILVGIFAGWIACWFAQGKHRKRARDASAELARLNIERADLLRRIENGNQAPQQIVPADPMAGPGWI
jgi:uncharacterized integral membrane protein